MRDLVAGVADEPGDDQRRERIEDRQAGCAPASAAMTVSDVHTSPRVCVASASRTSLPSRSAAADSYRTTTRLIADRDDHDDEAGRSRSRADADRPVRWLKALRSTSSTTSSRNTDDGRRRDGFVLAVAVGMVFVGRPAARAHADQADDVRRGVGERVEAVGQDADRAARVAERDLRDARQPG